MGTARRLYLYAIAAISLLVLAFGLYSLAAVALGEIADAIGASIIGGDSAGREQLSLAIALVVGGAPVFAIHWWLVARGWHGGGEAAADDRRSPIRAFHMGLVATVALAFGLYAALSLAARGLAALLSLDLERGRMTDEVAILVIAGPIWWLHVRWRNADIRHDRLVGAASWLTRLHRYGWAFIGLMFLVVGASQVIETTMSVLIGRSDFGGSDWWRGPVAWSIAAMVVGAGVWGFHLDDAAKAIRDAATIGEDDRERALRLTFFGAVILVALAEVGVMAATSVAGLGRSLLGVADDTSFVGFLESVVGPPLVAIPFALAGWLHWGAQHREAASRDLPVRAAAERLALHLASFVGLAFLAVGIARLTGALLEQVLGAAPADDLFRYELAWYLAQIIVGAALWLPAWSAVLRRRTAQPALERHATTSRAYLYLVVGGALIAGVPSAVFALYRLIDTGLGGRGTSLGSDLAITVAIVAVAAIGAAYHGRLLVSDLRLTSAAQAAAPPTIVAPAIEAGAELSAPTTRTLVLRGAGGEDLAAVAASLREHLPPGVSLEDG